MKPLRRNTKPDADEPAIESQPEVVEQTTGGRAPKGRPTPKRRNISGPVTPAPHTRKEAVAWQKNHARQRPTTQSPQRKSMTPAEYRAAVRRGDPQVLTRRDQGPVKALARDYVDSRRMLSNYILIIFPLIILEYLPVGTVRVYVQAFILASLIVIVLEWMYTGGRIRRLAVERGETVSQSSVALGFYAGTRAYLPRKIRRPAPRVKLHEKF